MAYWQKLTRMVQQLPMPAVTAQYQALAAWRSAVRAGQLPERPLPRLGLDEDAWLTARLLPGASDWQVQTLDHLLRHFRHYIAFHYGMWAFVSQPLFRTWTDLFGPQRYLELAAGNGYVSAGLQAAGNQVIATDALTWQSQNVTGRQPLLEVHQAGSSGALWRYADQVDAVVLAWSPDREGTDAAMLWQLRQHWPGLPLFVIGERNGATNSRLFWQLARFVPDRRLLPLNRAFPRFDAINDRIYLIR